MRALLLAASLLAATPALTLAGPATVPPGQGGQGSGAPELAFTLCYGLPESGGPFGDGTPAGELFALYATQINPDVLIFGEPLPDEPAAAPREAWLTGPVRGATAR